MAGEAAGGERPAEHPASVQVARVPPQERPTAGDPRVDAALARLDELPGVPVSEHPRIFDDVHRRLEDVLDELGSAGEDRGADPRPGR
jgi:uncharacterized Ntn-hydrolase superfamily protein